MANDELRYDVEEELFWEPRVGNDAIAVSIDDGDVTLRGTVGNPTPSDVRHSIKKAFKRDASLDAEALSIDTFDGTVTLAGHVASWVEHDAAVNAAWAAPGVHNVDDRIVVDY